MRSLRSAKRIVIKLGTQVVIDEATGKPSPRVSQVVDQILKLKSEGRDVVLVTSGAVALGRGAASRPAASVNASFSAKASPTVSQKQAFAAIGQSQLIEYYRNLFAAQNVVVAQLLLTDIDFSNRSHYLNLRETFEALLEMNAVPIINENDPVSRRELLEVGRTTSFGDNDVLSALVATSLGADALMILTNVDGVYTANPADNPEAKRIPEISDFKNQSTISTSGVSQHGRGGMSTKLRASHLCRVAGVSTVITSGYESDAITEWFTEMDAKRGTLIPANSRVRSREAWIGWFAGVAGNITINPGALQALKKGGSLLTVGITKVEGEFRDGDVVAICDEASAEIARGIARSDAVVLTRLIGVSTESARKVAKEKNLTEDDTVAVHRDDLVLLAIEGLDDH